ncbi:MAG TPA: dTMP kinase [Betaproteobacteria bacterium]|nr:dTMP kinase [Betaproteobacteria bacterium]
MIARNGIFITLEGIDGAGKSTHLAWLTQHLQQRYAEVVVSREPGGTPLGEKLRHLLLACPMHRETEALLMFAARREHLDQVIMPAIQRGACVISDRFVDASYAYQCGGRGLDEDKMKALEHWTVQDVYPDLTLLFDVSIAVAQHRLAANRELDRFEQEEREFFERVRNAYLERAACFPRRIRVIDAERPVSIIQEELEKTIASI